MTVGLLVLVVLAGLAFFPTAILEQFPSPGPQPEGLTSNGTHLWVTDFVTGDLYRIDTGTSVVDTFATPGPNPEGLAWDGTHLWSADWTTQKIYRHAMNGSDPGEVVLEFDAPPGTFNGLSRPVGLAFDGTQLWLTTWFPYALYRIDPGTGSVLFSRNLSTDPVYPAFSPRPEDLAWDGVRLWITDWFTREIYALDPSSLEVVQTIAAGATRSVGLTFHEGYLWNNDTEADMIYKLDVMGPVPVEATSWGSLKRRFAPAAPGARRSGARDPGR